MQAADQLISKGQYLFNYGFILCHFTNTTVVSGSTK